LSIGTGPLHPDGRGLQHRGFRLYEFKIDLEKGNMITAQI
jgi:hypothetical protein